MGVSTNGQLSYGIVFEEDFEFPWDADEFEGEIESWWRSVKGFVSRVECPYDEDGDYKPGVTSASPIIDEYYKDRNEWEKLNPIPIEVVNYCSNSCSMYILASKHIDNRRGFPVEIDLNFLQDTEDASQQILAFLDEFDIETDQAPTWWLSSFWDE